MARIEDGTADQDSGMEAPLLPLAHSSSDAVQPASCLRQCWREVPRILRLSIPLSANQVLSYASYLITMAQVGVMLGSKSLSSYALAQSFFNITGLSLVAGMSSAMDTFCGQAYGALQYDAMGIILQRAVLVCMATCLAPALLWTRAHAVMLLLGQQEELADAATSMVLVLGAGLPLDAATQCCTRFLASQSMVLPLAGVSLVTVLLRPFFNHMFMSWLRLGIVGAALGHVVVQLVAVVMLGVVIGWHNSRLPAGKKVWNGFSRKALHGWWPYLRVGLPSMAMICLGWWPTEALTLLAGLLPDARTSVAANGICFATRALTFLAVGGISGATSVRVSNELGAGHSKAAKRALQTALMLGLLVGGVGFAGPFWFGRHLWVSIFTQDPAVTAVVLSCMPMLLVSLLGDSADGVLGGCLRGCGRQMLGCIVTLVSYWLVGLPLAWLLALHQGRGVPGLWASMALVSSGQGLVLGSMALRLNWQREAVRAKELVRSQVASLPADANSDAGEYVQAQDGCSEALPGFVVPAAPVLAVQALASQDAAEAASTEPVSKLHQ